jgi:hypothetical protein
MARNRLSDASHDRHRLDREKQGVEFRAIGYGDNRRHKSE